MPDRLALSWSTGKDAARALHELRGRPDVTVAELLTTVSAATDRVSMHGVRRALVERQAAAAGLPLRVVELPADPANDEYEATMAEVMADCEVRGFDGVAFADLYLEDVRAYRESNLAETDLDGRWPLWGRDTADLAAAIVDAGFRATVVAVDGDALDESFVGREYDEAFLADLPEGVDPCGENGEFHSFVWDGPVFEEAVAVETGEVVTKPVGDGEYHYVDLVAAGSG